MNISFSVVIKRCRKILRSLVLSGAWVYQKTLGHTNNSASSGTLSITDSRTGRSYNVPIRNNAVKALDFIQITTAGYGAEVADHYDNSLRVLDQGLWNTAVTETSITYIDGKAGHMQYRDKTIDELFHNNNYEEVVHLLIWGTLPTQEQKMNLRRKLASHMKPPLAVENAIKAFPPDGLTHPMLLAGIAAFAAHDKGSQAVHRSSKPAYLGNMEEVDDAIIRTLAALATTVAMVYCYRRGRPFTQPNPDESYIGNILLMMGLTEEGGSTTPNRKIEHCLERLWVLNADHGMTNSTAVFLATASTLQDPLSCTVAAVASAYGPLHGGAVEMAYKEFERVQCVENVPQLISDVKAKKYRLFGYGHRIYKVKDPRGQLVRQLIEEYKEDVYKNSFLTVAMEIDRVAEEDSYFTSRNLKANADLYGCFLYTALGIETDTILSLSCLSRSPGVMAHWRESMDNILVANAYLVHTTLVFSKLCSILQKTELDTEYAQDGGRLKALFQRKYVTAEGNLMSTSQTGLGLAIKFGLYPENEEQRKTAGKALDRLVRTARFHISTGFAGTPVISHALSQIGRSQLAYRMLLETTCPSWLYAVVSHDATTVWEPWDNMLPDGRINPGQMTSFNHYALGAVGDWLHATVGGILPHEQGWRVIRVRPIPGGKLSSAKVSFNGPYGLVACEWKLGGQRFTMSLTIPPNCSALVTLPSEARKDFSCEVEATRILYSGHHSLQCHFDAGEWPPKPIVAANQPIPVESIAW